MPTSSTQAAAIKDAIEAFYAASPDAIVFFGKTTIAPAGSLPTKACNFAYINDWIEQQNYDCGGLYLSYRPNLTRVGRISIWGSKEVLPEFVHELLSKAVERGFLPDPSGKKK